MNYQVIKTNKVTNEVEIVATTNMRGEPLTRHTAENYSVRCEMANLDKDVIYSVEAVS